MAESLGRRLEMMENGKSLSEDIDRALGYYPTERPTLILSNVLEPGRSWKAWGL